jgi:hypothetical protein
MAKSYEHAWIICLAVSIMAVAGIAAGFYWHRPVIIAAAMLPAVIYEVYRTEGVFTKIAAVGSLVIAAAQIYVITADVRIDLSQYLTFLKAVKGMNAPIQAGFIGPVLLVLASLYLFRRTAGVYTKWLSIVIAHSSARHNFAMNPEITKKLFKSQAVQEQKREGVENRLRLK